MVASRGWQKVVWVVAGEQRVVLVASRGWQVEGGVGGVGGSRGWCGWWQVNRGWQKVVCSVPKHAKNASTLDGCMSLAT